MQARDPADIDRESAPEEIKDFLDIMIKKPQLNVEDAVHIVAGEYSMPRVEIGIGITEGELFYAVIGGDKVSFNIVLSPSLTQAARLSGSAAEVKEYLEKLYGTKNIPRKAYARDRKLFNQGIVITQGVFDSLRNEVEIFMIEGKNEGFSFNIYYYYDGQLDRYIALSKIDQPIALKGMDLDIEVYEVLTQATQLDAYVNDRIKKQKEAKKG
jgi:hypothetical protein